MLNKLSNFSPYLLLFPQMHTNTPTHKHTHTQTHPHRQINTDIHLLQKKKKHRDTQTHPHTNKPKRTNNKETDRCLFEQSILDLERSELVGLAWLELVGLTWSELVGMGLALSEWLVLNWCLTGTIEARGSCLIKAYRSRLIGARGDGSCLIGA